MKITYPHDLISLKKEASKLGFSGPWKLCKDGRHRQLRTKLGEILNYWESKGTIDFQGRDKGPLRKHFTAKYRADGKVRPGVVSPARTIESAAPVDYLPLDPREHLTRALFPDPHQEALLMNLNKRQGRIEGIFASTTHEAAAGELIFAGVRRALTTMPEEDVHAALCAVARAVMTTGKGFGLYARMDAIFQGTPDEEL